MKRIIANNVSKKFRIGFRKRKMALARFVSFLSGREPKKDFWALKGVSFSADAGEIIGIIGKNGSGKSTLLRVLAGIYAHNSGEIDCNGKIVSLIELNIGLHNRLDLRDNVYLCCALFGLGRKEIRKKFSSIVSFAGLNDFTRTKLYQFSIGMTQRLAFSIAVHCNPEILLLDEVFEVGDKDFRKKSSQKIKELAKKGAAVLLVTHDLDMVKRHCSRLIWVEKGKIAKIGSTRSIIRKYEKNGSNKTKRNR